MRPIKFRAWVDTPGIRLSGELAFMTNEITGIDWKSRQIYFGGTFVCDFSEAFLMQFTGLLDSKGVEIYEGDIIRIKIESPASDNPELADDFVCDVRWEKERMGWVAYGLGEMRDYFDCEVIGNIYENPELLTGGKK